MPFSDQPWLSKVGWTTGWPPGGFSDQLPGVAWLGLIAQLGIWGEGLGRMTWTPHQQRRGCICSQTVVYCTGYIYIYIISMILYNDNNNITYIHIYNVYIYIYIYTHTYVNNIVYIYLYVYVDTYTT